MKRAKTLELGDFPYASELITDIEGNVSKVVLDFPAYKAIISALEDTGLLRAMLRTTKDKALRRDEAIAYLNRAFP